MRFRPANNSLINSRSTPPTTLAAIVIQSCNSNSSEIFSLILAPRLTGPSITGWAFLPVVSLSDKNVQPTQTKKRRLVFGRVVVLILIQVSVELLSLRGWAEVRIGGQNFKQI